MRRPLAVVNVHGVRLPGAASRSVVNGLTKIGRFLLFQGKAGAVFGEIVFRLLRDACVGAVGRLVGDWLRTVVNVLFISCLPRTDKGLPASHPVPPWWHACARLQAKVRSWSGRPLPVLSLSGAGGRVEHGCFVASAEVCRPMSVRLSVILYIMRYRHRGVSFGLSLWQWHGDKRWEVWVWHGFRKKYVACLQRQAESEQQT